MKVILCLFAAAFAFTASAQTNLPLPGLPAPTNASPALAATNPPVEIFSDAGDFDLKNRSGVYRGHVRVIYALMKMTCDVLTAQVSTNGSRPETIIASGNVKLDGTDNQNRPVHVTCDKAVNIYKTTGTSTNDTITLTGNVFMESAMFSGTGDPIIYDRITDSIHGENLQMQGQPPAKTSGTNAPSLKLF